MQLSKKLRSIQNNQIGYWCQGCDESHVIGVREGDGPRWGWNGDVDKPTFTPSVLVRQSHRMSEKGKEEYRAWRDSGMPALANDFKFDGAPHVCHTFITGGNVQFLSDCTHQFAGQTLELPDLPEHLQD